VQPIRRHAIGTFTNYWLLLLLRFFACLRTQQGGSQLFGEVQ
jgi:hypothetical protein